MNHPSHVRPTEHGLPLPHEHVLQTTEEVQHDVILADLTIHVRMYGANQQPIEPINYYILTHMFNIPILYLFRLQIYTLDAHNSLRYIDLKQYFALCEP